MKDTQIKIHITGKDNSARLQLIVETIADQIITIAGNAGLSIIYSLAVARPRRLIGYTIDTIYNDDYIGDYMDEAIYHAKEDYHRHAEISAEKTKI